MEFTVIGEPTEPEEVGKCTGGKRGHGRLKSSQTSMEIEGEKVYYGS